MVLASPKWQIALTGQGSPESLDTIPLSAVLPMARTHAMTWQRPRILLGCRGITPSTNSARCKVVITEKEVENDIF